MYSISTYKDVPIADTGELDQAVLMAYAYLPQFRHTLTSYPDQLYSI